MRADVPELLRLVRELATYEKEPDAVRATVANYQALLFPPTGEPTGYCEVAEVDGRLVGMAFWYVTFSTWSGHRGIWLEDFFVEPEHRGAGLRQRPARPAGGDLRAAGLPPVWSGGCWTGTGARSTSTSAAARAGWTSGRTSASTARS